ncbi:hypothetical protein BDK63_002292 [Halomonas campaniensis]|uniref:Uncharacterized protein n=1 Tax=Halomonas campaniensis TaxID=213554 RepID=A0A7W5K3R9_9GAMM|nr:hypothetical protein [Halomonas campaniensis]MBB3331409.1 hypothetical protein [Halomonas campaniensis]
MTPDAPDSRWSSRLGRQLWLLLPELYRQRDESGQLAAWLDGCGLLLDQLHGTLEQRLDDAFPESAQGWILPYLGQLLDARLVSPTVAGRRQEVLNAVRWRKRKGTVAALEELAAAVADSPARVHEGWQRVITTYLPGTPLPRVVTPDFRYRMRRVLDDDGTPRLVGESGVPCFPDSHEDLTLRTAELSVGGRRPRRFHPRSLLLHLPPGRGFFPLAREPVGGMALPGDIACGEADWRPLRDGRQACRRLVATSPWRWEVERIRRPVPSGWMLESEHHRVASADGHPLPVTGRVVLDLPGDGVARHFHFQDLVFLHTLRVSRATLHLERCAASRAVVVFSPRGEVPALSLRDSLVGYARTATALCRLEHATVLGGLVAEHLQASDSLVLGPLRADLASDSGPPRRGCLRYSSLPALVPYAAVEDRPWLEVHHASMASRAPVMLSRQFGKEGCGVLHPDGPAEIHAGAEDGGEMGAYHHRFHQRRLEAVRHKLEQHLPLGMTTAIITDPRLARQPPRLRR